MNSATLGLGGDRIDSVGGTGASPFEVSSGTPSLLREVLAASVLSGGILLEDGVLHGPTRIMR